MSSKKFITQKHNKRTNLKQTLKKKQISGVGGAGSKSWERVRKFFGSKKKTSETIPTAMVANYTNISQPNTNTTFDNYLDGVVIKNENQQIIQNNYIITKSFPPEQQYFIDLSNKIKRLLPTQNTNEWEDCLDKCYNELHDLVIKEITTTAYMLRTISKCFIVPQKKKDPSATNSQTPQKHLEFVFTGELSSITGSWENDYNMFNIIVAGDDKSREIDLDNLPVANTELNPKGGRLIMGFGPSASGKTHCASLVIALMRLIKPDEFPDFFLTVDGGIFREQSLVYQTIISAANDLNIAGLSNLVSANFLTKGKTIFTSDIIKSTFRKYLAFQKAQGLVINLYVPETLGGCKAGFKSCQDKYQKYIELTGDTNWIGLMIYQHRTSCECPLTKDYKCTGTTESGKERETKEGKKYSSSAWDNSYTNGNQEINKASAHRFRIHNVGKHGGTYTIFEDLSEPKINIDSPELDTFFRNNNLVYIPDKVKYSDKCHSYSTDCKRKSTQKQVPRILTLKNVVKTVINAAAAGPQIKSQSHLKTEQSQAGQETAYTTEPKEEQEEEPDNEYESNV